jgi:hypothetical protein
VRNYNRGAGILTGISVGIGVIYLVVVYLMMLSVTQTIMASNDRIIVYKIGCGKK